MQLHVIAVTEPNLPLISRLNYGVTPKIEKKPTYFIFDTEPYSGFGEHIIDEEQLLNQYDSYGSTTVLRVE